MLFSFPFANVHLFLTVTYVWRWRSGRFKKFTSAFITEILLPVCIKASWVENCLLQSNFSLLETYLPAWIVESMGKNLRRLVGAVEVWVAPWDGVRDIAQVSIDIEAQYRTCKITERVGG